jgi:hypothetical protein
MRKALEEISNSELTEEGREKVLQLCSHLRAVVPDSNEIKQATMDLEKVFPSYTKTKEVQNFLKMHLYPAIHNYADSLLKQEQKVL